MAPLLGVPCEPGDCFAAYYPHFEQIIDSTSTSCAPAPTGGQPCIREIVAITNFRFGPGGRATKYGLVIAPRRRVPGSLMSTATAPAPLKLASWRTPAVLIAAGCAIALIAFGPRSALGQFLTPLSFEYGWGREAFSFAIAIQNLLWGAAQPFAGGIADRFGPTRVLCAGAILYATGLAARSEERRVGKECRL